MSKIIPIEQYAELIRSRKPPKPTKKSTDKPHIPLDVQECLRVARIILAGDPPQFVERATATGDLVFEFVLPLRLCPSQNTSQRHRPVWAHSKERAELLDEMTRQLRDQALRLERPLVAYRPPIKSHGNKWWARFHEPLPGRPHIHAIRFSSQICDESANFAKQAIDLLQPGRVRVRDGKDRYSHGLNVIANDDVSSVSQKQWGEKAPRGHRFVLLRVYSG